LLELCALAFGVGAALIVTPFTGFRQVLTALSANLISPALWPELKQIPFPFLAL
jgi:hypothetical protein